ncbi:MAG: Flp pilus assembly protein CpaB [Vampirovibrionales bacterium]|nr:Flp pilus assembly protein CpaB [Vampirovibrionales bacterium]
MQNNPRKPKKLVIQVIVAAFVAIIIGIGAIALVMSVLGSISASSQQAQLAAKKELEEKEAELNRLKAEQAQRQSPNAPIQNPKQVQALTDIAAGEPVTQGLVTLVDVQGGISQGTYTRISDVLGKVAKAPIVSGEVLTTSKVIDGSSVLQVKEGMRAVTIGIDNMASLNGALMPGSFVDILMTVDGPAATTVDGTVVSGGSTLLKTLLQNVQVISVGNGSFGGSTPGVSGGVTFLVSPHQAEILVLAGQKTKLTLALRNFKDKSRSRLAGADLDRLITGNTFNVSSGNVSSGSVKAPRAPKGQNAFNNQNVPVTYTPQALPEPSAPVQPARQQHSIKMYTGSGSQTVVLE